jgi:hypothetical protein
MNKMKKTALILLPLLLITLTGCTSAELPAKTAVPSASSSPAVSDTPTETPTATETPAAVEPTAATAGSVEALLNEVVVQEEQNSDAYERDMFNHWTSNNSTGCDTRFAVLVEESLIPAQTSGCKVLSGEWLSSYDGKTFTNPSELDIDHMIPLSEGWRSGASEWDAETRELYANDMGDVLALVAVSASSNRSKSDNDPSDWMPDTDGCIYVANWVAMKYRWSLAVDADEKSAILSILSFCPAGYSIATPDKAANVPAPTLSGPQPPVTEPVAPAPEVPATGDGTTDPQFSSCTEATANGYGPYAAGDAEYDFYRDGDGDGNVCE